MADISRPADLQGKVKWFLAVGLLLWMAFIAPFTSILALLNGDVFYTWWAYSLLIIPVPFLVLFVVFRTKNSAARWWIYQYLGASAICFSGVLIGILLSFVLPAVLAGKIALLLCFLFCAWGIYSAHKIHVITHPIVSEKIRTNVRLVQISDVHVGSRRGTYLEKVVKLVDTQKPDILAITGDLLDRNVLASDLKSLAKLPYPVFYCSGNHERYVNYEKALENIAGQGVMVLSDSVTMCLGLRVLGIEDRQNVVDAENALDQLQASELSDTAPFSVLLYHQPDLWECAKRHNIDLTLSGHTHKGQIWPFLLLVKTRYQHVAGLFKSASSHLFVSQGAGTWGPVMRFGSRCEITVLDLKSV